MSADGGAHWREAELLDDPTPWAWRRWRATVALAPGPAEVVARAWDSAASAQPADPAELWNPKGYANNAWARVRLDGHAVSVGVQRTRDQVHDEHERLVGLDHAAGAALAVAEHRRDGDPPPAADPHAGHALVPAGDHLAASEAELERVAPVPGGVELLAVGPGDPDVVHLDDLAGLGLRRRRPSIRSSSSSW